MWWTVGLILTVGFTSLSTCTPVEPASGQLTRNGADGGHVITTGVGTRDGNGHPHIRHEIRDLNKNYPDQWKLYLLGLLRFQEVDQNDPLSYYNISGIHARPYRPWQDATGPPGSQVGPYCPHSNNLFATWHRPYLALFEQELWKHVRYIADQAQTNAERWSAAADAFRIPYWDTAQGESDPGIPDFLTSPRWAIDDGPNGSQLIDNPLYWYQFHPLVAEDFADSHFTHFNQTMRWPTTQNSDAAPSVDKFINKYIADRISRQDWVSSVFQQTSYHEFSRALENAHGNIHIITGGDNPSIGHMYFVDFSAFDPIFMLHHASVDRLLALYLESNPGVWIQSEIAGQQGNSATFWAPTNTTIDANTGLSPFWKDDQNFWSSEDVRRTTVLGYAYPETQSWNFATDEEWRSNIKSTIQRVYANSARITLSNSIASGSDLFRVVEEGNVFTDWNIKAKASAAEMPPSFRVLFSLTGDFSSDPSTTINTWARLMPEGPEMVSWKARQAERKAKRSSMPEQDLNTTISLTSSLLNQIKAGKLESLDPEVVVPYLKSHLTWNVYAGADSRRMTPEQLDSFTVEVTSTKVRIPKDESQPLETIGDTTSYWMLRE